jgi:hypothetical protein
MNLCENNICRGLATTKELMNPMVIEGRAQFASFNYAPTVVLFIS